MPTQAKDIETVIPDLRDIPLDRRAELGSSALAQTIDRHREWLRGKRHPAEPVPGENLETSASPALQEAALTALAEGGSRARRSSVSTSYCRTL